MKKILVAYVSVTENTRKMAEEIAEGIRSSGSEVVLKKISEFKKSEELENYDGYVFGCPTYYRSMVADMQTFLFLARSANLKGKKGGAFGSYSHSGEAAEIVFETMQFVFEMDMVTLGPLNLKGVVIPTKEGRQACRNYGQACVA